MSDTPIYDQLSEMQKFAQHSGAYKLKYEILRWVEAEVASGRLKKTTDVEKVLKGIEGIKTWESESRNEKQSTGSGKSTTSKTSGTRSKSPRSNAPSKTSKTGSKAAPKKVSK